VAQEGHFPSSQVDPTNTPTLREERTKQNKLFPVDLLLANNKLHQETQAGTAFIFRVSYGCSFPVSHINSIKGSSHLSEWLHPCLTFYISCYLI
jgi:hypothetical protein